MGKGKDLPRKVSMGQDTDLCRYWEGLERELLFIEYLLRTHNCAGNVTNILSFISDYNFIILTFQLRSYMTFLRSHG